MNLLLLKEREDAARGALDLLRNRREAMVRELFAIAGRAVATREALSRTVERAMRALAVSAGLDGRAGVESAALAARRELPVSFAERNFWGVRLPEVRWRGVVRSADARGWSLPGVSSAIDDAARKYEAALESVLEAVAVESRIRKIGSEIAKATRRINVLTEVVLPGLRGRMRAIRLALEEREREETFRMKRFKKR